MPLHLRTLYHVKGIMSSAAPQTDDCRAKRDFPVVCYARGWVKGELEGRSRREGEFMVRTSLYIVSSLCIYEHFVFITLFILGEERSMFIMSR